MKTTDDGKSTVRKPPFGAAEIVYRWLEGRRTI